VSAAYEKVAVKVGHQQNTTKERINSGKLVGEDDVLYSLREVLWPK
jgi:hypothetical protein